MHDPTLDQPGVLTGAGEFLVGFIFFPSIFWLCEMVLHHSKTGREFCEHYKINNNGIHDISNKVTSSTFALLACTIGWFVNQQCTGDIMRDRFYILDNYLIFGVSYFFYDVISMYLVYNTLKKDKVTVSYSEVLQFLSDRPLIVFHHILVPLIGFPALMYFRNGYGDCLLGTSFMIEASTPFVSLRVILVHLNMKVIPSPPLLSITTYYDTLILSGQFGLHDQRHHDAPLLLPLQGHALPYPLLVVLKRPGHLPHIHNHLNTLLVSYCYLRTLVTTTILV